MRGRGKRERERGGKEGDEEGKEKEWGVMK